MEIDQLEVFRRLPLSGVGRMRVLEMLRDEYNEIVDSCHEALALRCARAVTVGELVCDEVSVVTVFEKPFVVC